jgi:hypothetical protein
MKYRVAPWVAETLFFWFVEFTVECATAIATLFGRTFYRKWEFGIGQFTWWAFDSWIGL